MQRFFQWQFLKNHTSDLAKIRELTHTCLSYFSLPFAQGGSTWTLSFLGIFRKNFSTKIAPYLYTPKTTINQQKEHSRNVAFQNGGQNAKFCFAKIVM